MTVTALITLIVNLLGQIAPALGASEGVIGGIIAALDQIIPVAVKEVGDIVPMIKNIIEALRNQDEVTEEQMKQLDALEAKIDAEFDQAASDEGV